ncbi:MAG: FAD-dependent oxidoreductase [Candidatus Hydrogenedentota bacterium]
MAELGASERPLRVAIIGSGPSGFYAADALLKTDKAVKVDMFDRLPTPFGLVRGGVAPDHPRIRNVVKVYERIAQNEHYSFLGNVEVGYNITVPELKHYYDALLFACGAETDRRMSIAGEELPGSHGATQFVGWYNGHPDYRHLTFDLSQEVAVVIGVGNVAIDVSRMLCKTVDELRHTEIAQHALDAFAESKIKEVHIIGRRGPAQAKFTTKELKELGELADCDPVVAPQDLVIAPEDEADMQDPTQKNNLKYLEEFAGRPPGKSKRLHFHFLSSPMKILGTSHVKALLLGRNELVGPPGQRNVRSTGDTWELPCGLVFRSIGYRGLPMPGVPFNTRWGTIPNEGGRVTEAGEPVPGMYCTGWIKRGPSGVIGTNKPDSVETVNNLLHDIGQLTPCPEPSTQAVIGLLRERGTRVVSFEDWKTIDDAEQLRGQAVHKPRERFTQYYEMLSLIRSHELKNPGENAAGKAVAENGNNHTSKPAKAARDRKGAAS